MKYEEKHSAATATNTLLHFTGSTLHHIISGHHEKNANSVLFDPRTIELTVTNDK